MSSFNGSFRRWSAAVWPLLQGTAAASVAWTIAREGFDHHEPFFAPIAAIVALNAPLGERGLNAMRLLLGVVVGIVVADLTVLAIGDGTGSLALATFAAMAIARAFGGARVMIAQAAVSAILTVAVADDGFAGQRLADAFIGAGVALVFSQFLFSPEPLSLVRRAESAALSGMAEGLELAASALDRDDAELADRAMTEVRQTRNQLADLDRMRLASSRVARRSVWRLRRERIASDHENTGDLDALGLSCRMLTRITLLLDPSERPTIMPIVRDLSHLLKGIAQEPSDRPTRQHAVDEALRVARRLPTGDVPSGSPLGAAATVAQLVVVDVMVFAGLDPAQAREAVRKGTGRFEVPPRPTALWTPLGPDRRRPRHGA